MIVLEEGWILVPLSANGQRWCHTHSSRRDFPALPLFPKAAPSLLTLPREFVSETEPNLKASPSHRQSSRQSRGQRGLSGEFPLVAGPGCVPRAACSPDKTCGWCSLLLLGAAPSTPADLGTVYGPFPINPNCSPSLQLGLRGRGWLLSPKSVDICRTQAGPYAASLHWSPLSDNLQLCFSPTAMHCWTKEALMYQSHFLRHQLFHFLEYLCSPSHTAACCGLYGRLNSHESVS